MVSILRSTRPSVPTYKMALIYLISHFSARGYPTECRLSCLGCDMVWCGDRIALHLACSLFKLLQAKRFYRARRAVVVHDRPGSPLKSNVCLGIRGIRARNHVEQDYCLRLGDKMRILEIDAVK